MQGPALSWRRPLRLRPGAIVGVCAPAGAVDAPALERGVAAIQDLGFRVRMGASVSARHRFTAGTVEERLRDLHGLLTDPDVAALLCARGGAGAGWLLQGLDLDLVRRRPCVLLGYSDVTFLHLALQRAGIVTFHGPMVAKDFGDDLVEYQSLRQTIMGEGRYAAAGEPLRPLRRGEGEGRLLGGCLSILAAAAGTPWALRPDPEGTILFLEDVDEKPYRLDRTLLQLRSSGAFEGVRGVVFGEMRGCQGQAGMGYGLEEVLLDALSGLDVPVAFGLPSGHTSVPNVTLPLGVRARIDCGAEVFFEVLEDAVS